MWPLPHQSNQLFEKAVNQPGFAKENSENSVWQFAGSAWVLYTFLSPSPWFYDSNNHNKSEHKMDILLNTLELKKKQQKNQGGGEVVIFLLLTILSLEKF